MDSEIANLAPRLTLKSQDRVSSVNSPARSVLPVLFHCRNHQHLCSARKADQELSLAQGLKDLHEFSYGLGVNDAESRKEDTNFHELFNYILRTLHSWQ